jgi:uncharacterized membrane protein
MLALSLGLNVFLLGFESARWLQRRAHSGAPEVANGPRHEMRAMWGPPTPELKAQRAQLHAARREVGEALVAEPFDRPRMEKALGRLREETSKGQQRLHEHLLERAATLPLEQRKKFASSRFFRHGSPRDPDSE